MLLGRRLIHKLVFVFLIVVLGLLSLQFLERKDTSRARHHEHSSLRIALPGDLAALAARRCRRGLPATGLRVLAPGGVARTRVGLWGCSGAELGRSPCTPRRLVSGPWMGRQRSVSAPSLPGAWLKRQRHLEGNRKSSSVCRSHGSRGPARRRRGEESGPAVAGRCGPITGCSPSVTPCGGSERPC